MKAAVILYMHCLSHGLKNFAGRCKNRVLFSAPNELVKLCKLVETKFPWQKYGIVCNAKHASPFVLYHGTMCILASQAGASIYVSWSTGGHFKTTICTSLGTARPALIMVK